MKTKNRIISVIISIFMLIAVVCSMILSTGAATSVNVDNVADAMEAILADEKIASSKKGDTVKLDKDGYIGIPVEIRAHGFCIIEVIKYNYDITSVEH